MVSSVKMELLFPRFYVKMLNKAAVFRLLRTSRLTIFFFLPGEDLTHLRDRNVEDLSGGELQRFACAVVCIQKADM